MLILATFVLTIFSLCFTSTFSNFSSLITEAYHVSFPVNLLKTRGLDGSMPDGNINDFLLLVKAMCLDLIFKTKILALNLAL